MKFKISCSNSYLWVPVQVHGDNTVVTFEVDSEKVMEFVIPIAGDDKVDFYANIPVAHWIGKDILISGSDKLEFYQAMKLESIPYEEKKQKRPAIHMTANTGWINDPNGLVYHEGVFHMYYQYNPFHTEWNNMSWGHSVSTDLLHWEQKDTVLWPDEYGMMFSGSGINNEKGLLDLPKDSILYYYSAAGGATPWSKDKQFIQGIAYSTDGGTYLTKLKDISIPTIEKENRDPKVFWHEESQAYIMTLWLQEDEFAILRSTDMKEFSISHRFRLKDAFECPDLFYLPVVGEEMSKWVFWCADGYYYIGDFDGYTFTWDKDKHKGYANKLPYAAQTVSGVEGRTISIPWLRTKFDKAYYTGAMGIPREFTLVRMKEGLRLQHNLCKEYIESRRLTQTVVYKPDLQTGSLQVAKDENPIELEISWEGRCQRELQILIGEEVIKFDFTDNQIVYRDESSKIDLGQEMKEISLIIDHNIVEITSQNSTLYIVYELPEQPVVGKIELHSTESEKLFNINIYE